MAEHHHDDDVVAGRGDDAADRRVLRDQDVLDGVAEARREVAVMRGVGGFVHAPELVPAAMALAEHDEEEVPRLRVHELDREVGLAAQPVEQITAQLGQPALTAVQVRVLDLGSEAFEDRGAERRRVRAEADVGIVPAPVDDLQRVDGRQDVRVWEIDDRDALPR